MQGCKEAGRPRLKRALMVDVIISSAELEGRLDREREENLDTSASV